MTRRSSQDALVEAAGVVVDAAVRRLAVHRRVALGGVRLQRRAVLPELRRSAGRAVRQPRARDPVRRPRPPDVGRARRRPTACAPAPARRAPWSSGSCPWLGDDEVDRLFPSLPSPLPNRPPPRRRPARDPGATTPAIAAPAASTSTAVSTRMRHGTRKRGPTRLRRRRPHPKRPQRPPRHRGRSRKPTSPGSGRRRTAVSSSAPGRPARSAAAKHHPRRGTGSGKRGAGTLSVEIAGPIPRRSESDLRRTTAETMRARRRRFVASGTRRRPAIPEAQRRPD